MSHQRKLMPRKQLEILLQGIEDFVDPKVELEQYPITPKGASTILSIISNTYNDIQGKIIGDLGCGTGILAIGAALLGAKRVIGVDIDQQQLAIAAQNARQLKVSNKIEWVQSNIQNFSKSLEIIIQNPPFGVQKRDRGMDLVFLKTAIKNARIIYSIHKSGEKNRSFLRDFIQDQNAVIDAIVSLQILIPHLYNFHRKKRYPIEIDLFRIISSI